MRFKTSLPVNGSRQKMPRLLEPDALRGLASIGVMLFHYSFNQPDISPDLRFRAGIACVDIFFMISGFVTFLSIHENTHLRHYLLNRFSRLFPVYWVCICISSLVMFFNEPFRVNFYDILVNMTMVQAFFGVEDLDGSYWTLLTELLFYSWVVVVYFLARFKDIEKIGAITVIALLLYHIFREFYPVTYAFAQLKFSITNHFPLFFSGILFYQIKMKGYTFKTIVLLLFSVAAALYLHDKGGRSMYVLSFREHALIIVLFHLIFIGMLRGKLKLLTHRYLIFLGRISYSLYLLHQYIGLAIISFLVSHTEISVYTAIFLAAGCSIWLAYLVTAFVEEPVIQMLRLHDRNAVQIRLIAQAQNASFERQIRT